MFMGSLISVSGDCNLVRDEVLSPKDKANATSGILVQQRLKIGVEN